MKKVLLLTLVIVFIIGGFWLAPSRKTEQSIDIYIVFNANAFPEKSSREQIINAISGGETTSIDIGLTLFSDNAETTKICRRLKTSLENAGATVQISLIRPSELFDLRQSNRLQAFILPWQSEGEQYDFYRQWISTDSAFSGNNLRNAEYDRAFFSGDFDACSRFLLENFYLVLYN